MLAGGVGKEGHWGGWECRTLRDAGSGGGEMCDGWGMMRVDGI